MNNFWSEPIYQIKYTYAIKKIIKDKTKINKINYPFKIKLPFLLNKKGKKLELLYKEYTKNERYNMLFKVTGESIEGYVNNFIIKTLNLFNELVFNINYYPNVKNKSGKILKKGCKAK